MKLVTHNWTIQSNFQECVILVTILGWVSWLRCSQNRICDPVFSAVAKDTISVWHMNLTSNNGLIFPNNPPRDLKGTAWIVYPAQAKHVTVFFLCSIIISFTFCDVFTCTSCEWCNLFMYVLKGGSWVDRFVKLGTCWRYQKHAFTFSLISVQPLSATQGWNLYQTNRTNIWSTWGISLSNAMISNQPSEKGLEQFFPFFHGKGSIAFLGSHGKADLTAVTVKRQWHLWHFPVVLVSASTCGQFVEARTCKWVLGNMEGYFSPWYQTKNV